MLTFVPKAFSLVLSSTCKRSFLTATKYRPKTESSRSIDPDDVERHVQNSSQWWNPEGPLTPLHSLNEIRVPFIRDGLISTGRVNPQLINTSRVLDKVNVLEVGCGGGILTEQLGRLYANVTGIDPGEELILAARSHLQNFSGNLKGRIEYKSESIELHCKENVEKYDAVIISEVIEHVNEKVAFLSACISTLKPGGSIFITTFDKSCFSLVAGVFAAEYIFGLVPMGTHDWNKFVGPIEMQRILDSLNCSTILVNGFFYEFWKDTWRWVSTTKSSYALQAVKPV